MSSRPGARRAATEALAAHSVSSGVHTLSANTETGGSYLGMLHGVMKMAKGAALYSGVGAVGTVGMELADLGMHAYRDSHDMSSVEISETIRAHAASFTPNQLRTVSEARRLFTFAKAVNPNHPAMAHLSDDAMRGGHVVVEDAGALDARFRAREMGGVFGGDRRGPAKPLYNLPSTHYGLHGAVQSEHQLPSTEHMNFGTALHGTTPGPAAHSWFQIEAHSGVWTGSGGLNRAYRDYALHTTDFARHYTTGRQIGPLGTSRVTEAQPLRVTAHHLRQSRIATAAANAGRARLIAGGHAAHAPAAPATPLG